MTSIQTASIRAAILAAGGNLELGIDPIDVTEPPTSGGPGYPVEGSQVGVVLVGLRRASPGRVVDIQITTVDLSATHTAIIDGTSVAYSGSPADVEELATAWAAAISGDATVGASGSSVQTTAEAVDRDGLGAVDTVRITGSTPDSWSANATVGGTGALSVFLDPESCTATVYQDFRNVQSIATRLDEPGILQGYGVMQGLGGDAVLTITDGQLRPVTIVSAGSGNVRPYVTGIGGVSGDGTTSGSTTVTLLDPVSVVLFGKVGS